MQPSQEHVAACVKGVGVGIAHEMFMNGGSVLGRHLGWGYTGGRRNLWKIEKPLKFNKIVCVSDDIFSLLDVPLYYNTFMNNPSVLFNIILEIFQHLGYHVSMLNCTLYWSEMVKFSHFCYKIHHQYFHPSILKYCFVSISWGFLNFARYQILIKSLKTLR